MIKLSNKDIDHYVFKVVVKVLKKRRHKRHSDLNC